MRKEVMVDVYIGRRRRRMMGILVDQDHMGLLLQRRRPSQQQQQPTLPGRPTPQPPSYSNIPAPELPRRTSSVSPGPLPPRSTPSPRPPSHPRSTPSPQPPQPQPSNQFTAGLGSVIAGRNALNKMGVSDRQILETSGRMAGAATVSSQQAKSSNGINASLKPMMTALPSIAPKPKQHRLQSRQNQCHCLQSRSNPLLIQRPSLVRRQRQPPQPLPLPNSAC